MNYDTYNMDESQNIMRSKRSLTKKGIIYAVSHFYETWEMTYLIHKWQKTGQGLPGVGEYWSEWAQGNFGDNENVHLDCGGG